MSLGLFACGGSHANSQLVRGATRSDAHASSASTTSGWHPTAPPLSVAVTRRLLNHPRIPLSVIREDGLMFGSYYGEPAPPSDMRQIAAVVKRYYQLAAREDAAGACAMMAGPVAKSLPVDYGKLGPRYVQGASTCKAVLLRVFRHSHRELATPIKVNGALVQATHAYAFLYSPRRHVSTLQLLRLAGKWQVAAPLGGRRAER